ncbi:hypothetical protein B0T25DRAFT_130868 [Lasiosphaeria hispida]|uniref:Zn(2)-C6 fungal-type domain-containing protein n=1 Tax=Lasiosphaeria hispida TaxID=260671 RepID=A0AAJ0HSL7_9PEZI|nr:hypothetical protein B0T25DRAFT_130868 [Lasiosphaeria hispida]
MSFPQPLASLYLGRSDERKMRKVQRHPSANDMPPLLKTCQICIRAKIRCEATRDSKACDRCLRLNKTCVFAPARRRNVAFPKNRLEQPEERLDLVMGSRSPGLEEEHSASTSGIGYSPPSLQIGSSVASWDPFTCGLLDVERASGLLNLFRSTMTVHFPFVVVPNTATLQDLRQQQPSLCLAVLAVAAFEDFTLQRKLSSLFNHVLASMLVAGKIISFDILQGLLVHLAWAHYQPRPRSYSQHLHLATSIVSDLRLDQRRKPQLWKVDFNNDEGHSTEWGSHELRALIGIYYLTSSSSVVLQKMRHFPYTNFILESCEKLEERAEFPNDKYLKNIVRIQRILEDVDDIVAHGTAKFSVDEANTKLATIRNQLGIFKTELTFPLSECPTLLLQLGMVELVISQRFLPGSPFPVTLSASQEPRYSSAQVVDLFSDSILASKSLINILITMVPGQEKVLSNLGWITLSCALSFSARLSLLAGDNRISYLTKHLQRSLDIRHTLRQVILRLSSMVSPGEDSRGDRDTFYHFLRRAEAIEAWYLRQTARLPDSTLQGIGDFTLALDSEVTDPVGGFMGSQTGEMTDQSMMDFFSEEMLRTGIWEPLPLDNLNSFWG